MPIGFTLMLISPCVYVNETTAQSPIASCMTIENPGTYRLVNNLVATGDCIVLKANFVTVNLGGFRITGNGGGAGITNLGGFRLKGIEVRNGAVTHFSTGISLDSASQVLIQGIRVAKNTGFGVWVSENAIVKDNLAAENGLDGLHIGPQSIVAGNTSVRNGGSGIVVAQASTVVGNVASLNSDSGIIVYGRSTVLNNTSASNTNFGISVDCSSNVIGNTTTGNGINLMLSPDIHTGNVCNSVNNVTE